MVEPNADVDRVVHVLRRLGHADAHGGDGLGAERETAVEHEHARGGDPRRATTAWCAQGDRAALAVDELVGRGELLDVVRGVVDEERPGGLDRACPLLARHGDRAQDACAARPRRGRSS